MATDRTDSRNRFSSRVDAYVKYRPGYPPAVIDLLQRECGLTPDAVVADVGSGTGILSEMTLKNGNVVYGVEPNAEMRGAAEKLLAKYPNFRSANGSGEHTTLANASVDLVTCAQAFHWLNGPAAAAEFRRICKPGGSVVVMWNARLTDRSEFLREYDELLIRHGTDYAKVAHEKAPTAHADLERHFRVPFTHVKFPNEQSFDLDGLRGRVASSSYTPGPGEPGFAELFAAMDELFARFAKDGRVAFEYDTEVFYARL
jgi:SAM-dependent methyltransferase